MLRRTHPAGAVGRGAALPPGGRTVRRRRSTCRSPTFEHQLDQLAEADRVVDLDAAAELLTARAERADDRAEGRAVLRRWHRRLARRRAAGPRRAGSPGDVLRRPPASSTRGSPFPDGGRPVSWAGLADMAATRVRHDRLPHAHAPGARRCVGDRRRRRDRPLRRVDRGAPGSTVPSLRLPEGHRSVSRRRSRRAPALHDGRAGRQRPQRRRRDRPPPARAPRPDGRRRRRRRSAARRPEGCASRGGYARVGPWRRRWPRHQTAAIAST